MITGRQALASIENAVTQLRSDERRLEAALAAATDDAGRLRRERVEAFKALARVKLDSFLRDGVVGSLDAAERRAMQMLESRKSVLAALDERRDAAARAVEAAEAFRHDKAQAVETALAAVENLRAAAAARAAATPAYAGQQVEVAGAQSVAEEAERKASASESELGEKKKPYDADALFQYLWARGFGTSRYAGTGLVKLIDGWVARFAGFEAARANYQMLTEIPLRLREHAARRLAAVAPLRAALADIERRVMVEAGIEPVEAALAAARAALESAEHRLIEARAALAALDQQHAATAGGANDPVFADAVALVAESDQRSDFRALYLQARQTPTLEDEAIVGQIADIDRAIAAADAKVGDIRRQVQEAASRRGEVEATRERFRNAGYDHPQVVFGNENAIGSVLSGIIQGAVQGAILWSTLRGGYGTQAPRVDPDFGGSSMPFPFPMPGQGGSSGWSMPSGGGSWSLPSGGDSGGSSGGDGFSTGGSI